MVKGVIFDMDGTMFDTERLSTKGWIYAGEKLGVEVPRALVDAFRGTNPTAIRNKFTEYFGDRLDYDQTRAVKHEYFEMATKDGIPLESGLVELLKYLNDHKIPAAVATSTEQKRAEMIIKKAGVYEMFSGYTYGDLIERSKPAPDIFLKAAELIGQKPEECLVLEDSAPGLAAGKAAGGYTIYIPDEAIVPEEAKIGISAELPTLNEVIAWIEKENNK